MTTKFTMRRNGQRMMTVRLAYHVSEDAVRAVASRLGVTLDVAARKIRDVLENEASNHLDWYGFHVEEEKKVGTKTLRIVHSDEVSNANKADLSEYSTKIGHDAWIPTSGKEG